MSSLGSSTKFSAALLLACLAAGGCKSSEAQGEKPSATTQAPTGQADAASGASGKADAPTTAADAATGAATGDAPPTNNDGCTKVWSPEVEGLRLVSKAAAAGSDIDQTLEFGTGRISGTGYKMVEATLEPQTLDYQATPEQIDALREVVEPLCLHAANSTGEAPKGFVRYGLVGADGEARWMVGEGQAAGLPAEAEFFVLPRASFTAINRAWPRPSGSQ